jgi:hypothetical protein
LIKYNINYSISNFLINKIPIIENCENIFTNAIKLGNSKIVRILLELKFMPKIEHYFCLRKHNDIQNYKIIKLLVNYGLSLINDTIYLYLLSIPVNKLETFNFSGLSMEPDKFKNYFLISNKKPTSKKTIRKLSDLEDVFRYLPLDKIKNIMNKSDIIPGNTCFREALYNINTDVMEYVFSEYKYIPSIIAINKVQNFHKRINLIIRFYPDLIKMDIDDEIKKKDKPVKNKKNI